MWFMKYFVLIAFVAIIGSLAFALVYMMKGGKASDPEETTQEYQPNPMSKALAFRVGFSILLFVVVLVSYWAGWITPTGVPMSR
jgi:uncharacterized membrane protein (DUF4010 family)